MIDTEITEKFTELESSIAAENGPFAFFALFMREEVPDRWDLMVAAPWAGGGQAGHRQLPDCPDPVEDW